MFSDVVQMVLLTLFVGLLAPAGLIVVVLGRLWWANARPFRRVPATDTPVPVEAAD